MTKKIDLAILADLTNCHLVGNPDYCITGISDLESATACDAAFLSNERYLGALKKSLAGVIFVASNVALIEGRNYLVSEQPSQAFQKVIDLFHPAKISPSGFDGIHPSAIIHESVQLGQNVSIGPYAVLDAMVIVGDGTFIGAGTYIGQHTSIGDNCLIHPHVTIREECIIGHRVIIQPGAVIGACGFGYITDKSGQHRKLNQVGNVKIDDDVEIGANTTIDRARFKSTSVGCGSKIDNLVQIGHGVSVGAHNLIVAQTGIAGSTSTDKNVTLAGQVAVAGHLHIGKGIRVAGKSAVCKSLVSSGDYGGNPAIPVQQNNRIRVFVKNIEQTVNQVKELFQRLEKIEQLINISITSSTNISEEKSV